VEGRLLRPGGTAREVPGSRPSGPGGELEDWPGRQGAGVKLALKVWAPGRGFRGPAQDGRTGGWSRQMGNGRVWKGFPGTRGGCKLVSHGWASGPLYDRARGGRRQRGRGNATHARTVSSGSRLGRTRPKAAIGCRRLGRGNPGPSGPLREAPRGFGPVTPVTWIGRKRQV